MNQAHLSKTVRGQKVTFHLWGLPGESDEAFALRVAREAKTLDYRADQVAPLPPPTPRRTGHFMGLEEPLD